MSAVPPTLNTTDTLFVLISTGLVLLMTPALGFVLRNTFAVEIRIPETALRFGVTSRSLLLEDRYLGRRLRLCTYASWRSC